MSMTWVWWWNVQDRTVVGIGSEGRGPGRAGARNPHAGTSQIGTICEERERERERERESPPASGPSVEP